MAHNAKIVKHPHFESALVKIQREEEHLLTSQEKRAVISLRKIPVAEARAGGGGGVAVGGGGNSILAAASKLKKARVSVSEYENTLWIPPDSNAVERLFSRAKLVLTPKRMSMLPLHLEVVLFIHLNRQFWNESTVQEIFLDKKEPVDDAMDTVEEEAVGSSEGVDAWEGFLDHGEDLECDV